MSPSASLAEVLKKILLEDSYHARQCSQRWFGKFDYMNDYAEMRY